MTIQRTVSVNSLGICEHCGTVISMQDAPADAIDAKWLCPKCDKELTNKSFGYEEIKGKWGKTKWVGADGKWTGTEPTKSFDLGSFFVVPAPQGPFIPIWRY